MARGDALKLTQLAGITRILGMVRDPEGDVILVGLGRTSDLPPLTLDDVAVGLRAGWCSSNGLK